jgi:hypothetical protein
MNRYRPSLPRHSAVHRLVGGTGVVLLYLLSATSLAPALTTLLAMLDGSHHVTLQQTACGIRVVLRHDCFNSSTHRHGIIARTLTLVAQRPTQGRPDHVIQFAAVTTSEQASAPLTVPVADSSASDLFLPCDPLPHATRLTDVSAAHPRPPPDASSLLLSIRSTVLLI